MRLRFSIAFLATIAWPVLGLTPLPPQTTSHQNNNNVGEIPSTSDTLSINDDLATRRYILATFASDSSVMLTLGGVGVEVEPAIAAENSKPAEFVSVGTQAPPPDGDAPFVTLANGVKIKDFRVGSGDGVVSRDSRVSIQCSGRLLNLNGVVFYNTKNNNPDGFGAIPLTIDLGKGQAVPGLEAGLIGMKKGGIRRIIVPDELAYSSKNPDLEPKPMNGNDQRALDSVVKNSRRDGSILFDVQVERIK